MVGAEGGKFMQDVLTNISKKVYGSTSKWHTLHCS